VLVAVWVLDELPVDKQLKINAVLPQPFCNKKQNSNTMTSEASGWASDKRVALRGGDWHAVVDAALTSFSMSVN